ncbi:MAG: ComF family protein [Minisyncoccota bacterium]
MRKLVALFTNIFDLIFPRQCLGCALPRTLLCKPCLAKIPPASPAPHSFIRAVFDYHHPIIKRAVWRFKYENARGFANIFAEKLYEEIVGDLGDDLCASENEIFLLVPIPLHKKRLRERGYNQSELLAHAILKRDNNAHIFELAPELIMRTRATAPQARSEKRAARLSNLHGAFICTDAHRVRGRTIILIDDVTTTGTTLHEAARALMKAKPRKILAFTVAH